VSTSQVTLPTARPAVSPDAPTFILGPGQVPAIPRSRRGGLRERFSTLMISGPLWLPPLIAASAVLAVGLLIWLLLR
jgi:hypothetical protein